MAQKPISGKKRLALIIFSVLFFGFFLIPVPGDQTIYSKTVYDQEGALLSATTSADGQWALPLTEELPTHFNQAIVCYEDEYMGWHPGINPVSIAKSLVLNLRAGKVKRGGSTIAMQVMRMRFRHRKRSVGNKVVEMLAALKYSLLHTDETLLHDWAAIAPFGGNTVGAQAASLRYFGRNLDELSWAEYALLAVLPNNPTAINVGRQKAKLKLKRDELLKKLARKGYFSEDNLQVYSDEDLPSDLFAIPQRAYHFLRFCSIKEPGEFRYQSTIDGRIQDRLNQLMNAEAALLQAQDIQNMSAVVIDIQENTLLAYVGNVNNSNKRFAYNDLVQAQRGYGSLLKPLLYANALQRTLRLPSEMLPDIPISIGDFRPENFDKKYRGSVAMDDALIQSLNVPMVRLLYDMGYPEFYHLVHDDLRIGGLDKGADHYGLSIILGGGESSLWELARIYKGLGRNYAGWTYPFENIRFLENQEPPLKNKFAFDAYSISHLVQAMTDLSRPREEKSWELFAGQKKIAWKTGTSFGHRDAWAIGFTGKYLVAVWVGNETGASRPGLTGVLKAAPVMFGIFNQLPADSWFDQQPAIPRSSLISVCSQSGMLAGRLCQHTYQLFLPMTSYRLQSCDKHELVYRNEDGFILKDNCLSATARLDTIFELSPVEAFYYQIAHPEYTQSHLISPDCKTAASALKIIYPSNQLKIFLPRENQQRKFLFVQVYQAVTDEALFWFLDGQNIQAEKMEDSGTYRLDPGPGKHHLLVTDASGNTSEVYFEILEAR